MSPDASPVGAYPDRDQPPSPVGARRWSKCRG